jgi:hypothetical protein
MVHPAMRDSHALMRFYLIALTIPDSHQRFVENPKLNRLDKVEKFLLKEM